MSTWSDSDFHAMDSKLDELVVAVTKLAANEHRTAQLEDLCRGLLNELKIMERARVADSQRLALIEVQLRSAEVQIEATKASIKAVDTSRAEDRRELDKWKFVVMGCVLTLSAAVTVIGASAKIWHN